MRGRTILAWMLGLVFVVTLAVVVGQRLSAQAMAVVIGILAGIAASIPTSLFVVWVTSRLALPRGGYDAPPRPEPRERPIVVMQAPPPAPAYRPGNGYGAPNADGYNNGSYSGQPQVLPPRRFTVVGGGPVLEPDEDDDEQEAGPWNQ
jgi:hypothetical protein